MVKKQNLDLKAAKIKAFNKKNLTTGKNQSIRKRALENFLKNNDMIIVRKELNKMNILVNLYKLLGLEKTKIYNYLFKRHQFIKKLEFSKRKNNSFQKILNLLKDHNNIKDVYDMDITKNYYNEYKRLQTLYKMKVNTVANVSTVKKNSNMKKLHLILQGDELKSFLKKVDKKIINTEDNLKIISSYMNCGYNKLLDEFFGISNITSNVSLENFFEKTYQKQEFILPTVSVILYEVNGKVVKINFDNINFNHIESFISDEITPEFINSVNCVTGIMGVCGFKDLSTLLKKDDGCNKKWVKLPSTILKLNGNIKNNVNQSSKAQKNFHDLYQIHEKNVLTSLNIYNCIKEFINEISFIIDLLEELKIENFLDKIINFLYLKIKYEKALYYEENDVHSLYDPVEYFNVDQEYNKIVDSLYDDAPIRLKNFSSNKTTKGVKLNFIGNINIAKSIVDFLRANTISSSNSYYLLYNGLHLYENQRFFDNVKIISEIFGKDGIKKILINRNKFKTVTTKINVNVEGLISNSKFFIQKLNFYNADDIYYINYSPDSTRDILTSLTANNKGLVPFGLFNMNDTYISSIIKKKYNKNIGGQVKKQTMFTINDIKYIQDNKLAMEQDFALTAAMFNYILLVFLIICIMFLSIHRNLFYKCCNTKASNGYNYSKIKTDDFKTNKN